MANRPFTLVTLMKRPMKNIHCLHYYSLYYYYHLQALCRSKLQNTDFGMQLSSMYVQKLNHYLLQCIVVPLLQYCGSVLSILKTKSFQINEFNKLITLTSKKICRCFFLSGLPFDSLIIGINAFVTRTIP